MIENSIPVIVRILDKEYRVACNQGEEESLIAAARLVDQKMREIRSSGKVLGTDRIAVMASLNLAHELLENRITKMMLTAVSARVCAICSKRLTRLLVKKIGWIFKPNRVSLSSRVSPAVFVSESGIFLSLFITPGT